MDSFQQKALSDFELKASDKGAFRATIATFLDVDRDGDVTFPGAFPVGKQIIVGAFNHTSMPQLGGALPTGVASIGADNSRAYIDGKFFLDTPHGAAMYETVKALGSVAEWSYAYPEPKTAPRHSDQMKNFPTATRGIVGVDPVEASACIRGAGTQTRTDFIKSEGPGYEAKVEQMFTLFAELKVGRALSAATLARLGAIADELTKFLAENVPQSAETEGKVSDEALNRLMRDLERMRSEQLIPVRFL
jgi:hypothetical protein